MKDALQPNFQQVEESRFKALVQALPGILLKSKVRCASKVCGGIFDHSASMQFFSS